MQRHRSIIVLALALIMAIPAYAAAEWGGRGFYEPDTKRDREGGFMFADPDQSPDASVRQVYFGVYTAYFVAGGNPNVASIHSNFIPFPVSMHAILGVWKDCNRDGYVGTQEGALFEYRAELLLDASVCPAGEDSHNDGEWVQEFLGIGPDNAADCTSGVPPSPDNDTNPYNLDDPCARVWGDWGLPEDMSQLTCPINPRPRGTYQSTGGVIRFADCIANYRIHGASVAADGATDADEALGFQVGMDDAPRERPDQSRSILNQKNPYGHEADASYVRVSDCSEEGTVVNDPTGGGLRRVGVSDPTGLTPDEVVHPLGGSRPPIALKNSDGTFVAVNATDGDGRIVTVRNLAAPNVDASGSPHGTGNETLEGSPSFGFGGAQTAFAGVGAFAGGDCDRSDGGFGENADVYELDEGDFEPSSPARQKTDFFFNFVEGTRRGQPGLGDATPGDGGQGANRELLGAPFWFGAPGTTASRNGFVRTDDFSLRAAQYATFYAYVSSPAVAQHGLILPGGAATRVYGDEHCSGETPTTGGFDCDPDAWWPDPTNPERTTKTVWQVTVGQEYNLFDIDCYDQTITPGVPTTTGLLTGTSCAR